MLTVEDRAWKSSLPQAFMEAGLHLGYNLVDINGVNQTGSWTDVSNHLVLVRLFHSCYVYTVQVL